jgi:hypothetical protein
LAGETAGLHVAGHGTSGVEGVGDVPADVDFLVEFAHFELVGLLSIEKLSVECRVLDVMMYEDVVSAL